MGASIWQKGETMTPQKHRTKTINERAGYYIGTVLTLAMVLIFISACVMAFAAVMTGVYFSSEWLFSQIDAITHRAASALAASVTFVGGIIGCIGSGIYFIEKKDIDV